METGLQSTDVRSEGMMRGRQTLGVGFLLLLAFWFGLVTGLVEVIYLVRRAAHHVFVWHGQQALWMIPLAEGALFLTAGLVIVALRPGSAWLRTLTASVTILGTASAFSALTLYGRLHPLANLLLAVGLAAAFARLVGLRPHRFRRVVGWTSPTLMALVVTLAVGLNLWLDTRERRWLASLPPASRDAPNVLLIVLDTVRAPSLSLYGYPRTTTPNLERFARSGVRFERAIAPSSWTLPTHATIFTGRELHEHRANWQIPLDGTYPTLAEYLSRHGYRTAGFVANRPYTSWQTGLARGFAHYEDYGFYLGEWLRCSTLARKIVDSDVVRRTLGVDDLLGRRNAREINRLFLEWVDGASSRPFFVFLNYYDAHFPYLPPKPFSIRFGVEDPGAVVRPLRMADQWKDDRILEWSEVRRARDAYDGAIAHLDSELGLLFAALEQRDLLDDTIVIVTSDHGEEFAEHQVTDHGKSLYLPAVHVPLVIVHPGHLPRNLAVDAPVGLRDLPATVVDLLDVASGAPFPGRSLFDGLSPAASPAEGILSEVTRERRAPAWYPISRGDMRSLILDSLHYIRNGDQQEEIYNLFRDPWEKRNLAPALANDPVIDQLRDAMERRVPNGGVAARRPTS